MVCTAPIRWLLPTSACKRTESLALVPLAPLPVNKLLLLLFVSYIIFVRFFLNKLSPVFEYGLQTFLISKLGVFYLKLKLFCSTSIAGGLLADTKKYKGHIQTLINDYITLHSQLLSPYHLIKYSLKEHTHTLHHSTLLFYHASDPHIRKVLLYAVQYLSQ